jgi:hypothetical protein
LLIKPIFLKAATVLKLDSYWFLRFKAANAVSKEFKKSDNVHINDFLKAAKVDNIFADCFKGIPAASCGNPLKQVNNSCPQKLFRGCTDGFQ